MVKTRGLVTPQAAPKKAPPKKAAKTNPKKAATKKSATKNQSIEKFNRLRNQTKYYEEGR